MSFIDKLKFWKKDDDDFALPETSGLPPSPQDSGYGNEFPGMPGTSNQSYGAQHQGMQNPGMSNLTPAPGMGSGVEQQRSFGNDYGSNNYQAQASSKDTEIILARLDALKNALDNVSLRLERLEKALLKSEPRQQDPWKY